MTDEYWGWYASEDGERYQFGPYQTREEAIQVATDELDEDQSFVVAYCQRGYLDLSTYFDIEEFLEGAEDAAYDYADPDGNSDGLFHLTPDQQKELQDRVRETITTFCDEQGLRFPMWTFLEVKNEETINA